MLLRNDSDVPLHIPPSESGPGVLVEPGDEIASPVHVAGLTPVDHEFIDGEWRPAGAPEPADDAGHDEDRQDSDPAAPAKPAKTPAKPKQQSATVGGDPEGVTP